MLTEKKDEIEQPKINKGYSTSNKRCRYWNRGFCKEKSNCLFNHVAEDCESFQEDGSCSDRACKKRHRKECRYYRRGNCFRGEKCEYKHKTKDQLMTAKKDAQEGSQRECFNCEYCDFTCRKKGIMNKHMKTDHQNIFGLDYKHESIAQFIRRLGLERFSNQYQNYFREYDFENCKDFLENIILSYGEDFILEFV